MSPSSSQESSDFYCALLSYMVRNKLHEKHPDLFGVMKTRFDAALDKSWMIWKGHGFQAGLWLEAHKSYIGAVCDFESLQQCFSQKSDWMAVAEEMGVVCQTTFGQRIFGNKLRGLVWLRLCKIAEEAVSALPTKVNKAAVDKVMETVGREAQAHGRQLHDQFDTPLDVKMVYRGVEISISCRCLQEVVTLRVACVLKSEAVRTEELPSLWCEDELVEAEEGHTDTEKKHEVAKELLAPWILARKAAASAIKGDVSGEQIKATLLSKQQVLVSLDPSWKVEHSFFLGMVGGCGEAQIKRYTLRCLPTAEGETMTVEQSLEHLGELERTQLYTFAPQGGGGQIYHTKIKELVTNIKQGRAPKFAGAAEAMTEVKALLANFCTFEEPGSAKQVGQSYRGKEALKRHLARISKRCAEGESLSLADVAPLVVFAWLLTGDDAKEASNLTKKLIKNGCASVTVAAKATPKGPRAKAKAESKAKDVDKVVKSFFK